MSGLKISFLVFGIRMLTLVCASSNPHCYYCQLATCNLTISPTVPFRLETVPFADAGNDKR
jgi:hypothetical protein